MRTVFLPFSNLKTHSFSRQFRSITRLKKITTCNIISLLSNVQCSYYSMCDIYGDSNSTNALSNWKLNLLHLRLCGSCLYNKSFNLYVWSGRDYKVIRYNTSLSYSTDWTRNWTHKTFTLKLIKFLNQRSIFHFYYLDFCKMN